MMLDKQQLYSSDQAITASAASTNVIDHGAQDAEVPAPNRKTGIAKLFAVVNVAFTNLTTLKISLQTDGDEAFGSATTLYERTIALASLTAGKLIFDGIPVPGEIEQYTRLYYTVVGSAPDAGKITAGLVMDVDMNLS